MLARVLEGLSGSDDVDSAGLVECAIAEGVAAILVNSRAYSRLAPTDRHRVADRVRADAIRAAALDRELQRVLAALAAEGLAPLLLKGAHLAHTVYPRPWFRPRSDTDLLIGSDERDRVATALLGSGYAPAAHVRGRVILGQFHFERLDPSGIAHYLDVHWRIAAPLLVERCLPARRLFQSAEPVPAQGPHARAPALPHALLLGCVHLVAHHRTRPMLRWLYDLRLIAEALDEKGRQAFVDLTREVQCCAIAAHALRTCTDCFDRPVLHDLVAAVESGMPPDEPSAALLRVTRPVGAVWIDLRTAGWRDGARLLREHLLPDREYMRSRSGGRSLPLAYVGRAVLGLKRWATGDRAEPGRIRSHS